MLSAVTGASCRAYAKSRGGPGGARRNLEDLRAAINHHAKEGLHRGEVRVVLPAKGAPRERWLIRSEAATLLWTCWRHREVQTAHRGSLRGQKIETDKRPLRHLARFILIGLYTGTRGAAIASASPRREGGRSFVDLDAGIFYRLAQGRRATNKRQPPVPLPRPLLAHMRRWERLGIAKQHFVDWHGKPVSSVKTAFRTAVRLAKLSTDDGNVTPHTLRHHSRNVVDAERRADVGCGWLPWHERKNFARCLRPPSSRTSPTRCRRDCPPPAIIGYIVGERKNGPANTSAST